MEPTIAKVCPYINDRKFVIPLKYLSMMYANCKYCFVNRVLRISEYISICMFFFVGKSYGGFVFQADSKHGILFCIATNH